jgi:hypothetical protein
MVGIHSIETDNLETSCLLSGGGEDVVWFAHSCLAKAHGILLVRVSDDEHREFSPPQRCVEQIATDRIQIIGGGKKKKKDTYSGKQSSFGLGD